MSRDVSKPNTQTPAAGAPRSRPAAAPGDHPAGQAPTARAASSAAQGRSSKGTQSTTRAATPKKRKPAGRQTPRRAAPASAQGPLRRPRPVWFVTLMAFVLPGSGQVLNGAPARGVIMQFGMIFMAYITFQITTPDISLIGRAAGGLLVYVFSVVDANGIAKRRVSAWERMGGDKLVRKHGASRAQKGTA